MHSNLDCLPQVICQDVDAHPVFQGAPEPQASFLPCASPLSPSWLPDAVTFPQLC